MNPRNYLRSDSEQDLVSWLVAIGLAVLHLELFTYGYRLTADDVAFHDRAMMGASAVFDYAMLTALDHGRIGHFLSVPLNAIGAYFADSYAFRGLYVGLYGAVFYFSARFVSVLVGRDITLWLFVVMLSLHPLDYAHLPPNSYPLQNTIPLLIILVVRLSLWRASALRNASWTGRVVSLRVAQGFAMLFNEYAFVFGAALMGCEAVARMSAQLAEGTRLGPALSRTLFGRDVGGDALTVVAVLAAYLTFRTAFPSAYEGNQLDGLGNATALFETLLGHIYTGTSIARFSLADVARFASLDTAPIMAHGAALIAGVIAGWLAFVATKNATRIRAPGLILLTAAVYCAFVTFPIAATAKYQQWCPTTCAYLDSRISYLGVSVIVGVSFLLAVLAVPAGRTRLGIRLALAGCAGILSCLTYFENWHVAQHMRSYVAAWERASVLTCATGRVSESDRELVALIDREKLISFHPGFAVADYWRRYIADREVRVNCEDLSNAQEARLSELRPPDRLLIPGRKIGFSDPNNARYLSSGWSAVEPWGVWSDGESAYIEFELAADPLSDLKLLIGGHALLTDRHPVQTVTVSVNGFSIGELRFEQASNQGLREVRIPRDKALSDGGRVTIRFDFEGVLSPFELGLSSDTRRLGLGLVTMELEE